jgi:ferrochelatase
VRAYLGEFLSDPRVVPLPRWLWLPLLHFVILKIRSPKTAEKYAQIWTAEGSPLAVHTARQANLLGAEYAMRYGEPNLRSRDLRGRVVVPLYPQFADSTTGSVLDLLPAEAKVVRDFHDHPGYIAALAAVQRRHWQKHGRAPMLVMSFHGLPRRGAGVYPDQCMKTAQLLAKELKLDEYRVAFQSRFGYAAWLEPSTEATLIELARAGMREVDVVCPGFVADCLETLEEIGIRARERFIGAGGRELRLVECLNEAPEWIAALREISARTAP